MALRGPEGKLQDKFVRYLKAQDIHYKKQEVGRYMVSSGWPDFAIFPGKGRVFFVELKAPGKKPTPLQEYQFQMLRADGYAVHVADSFDNAVQACSLERKSQ